MGRYSIQGKIIRPLSSEEWLEAMENGRFVKDTHRGYVALLYYTAVRRGEALRTKKNSSLFEEIGYTILSENV